MFIFTVAAVSLLTLLLAEHLYTPVSTLIAPIIISSTLIPVTLPTPVDDITGLPDTSLLLSRLLPQGSHVVRDSSLRSTWQHVQI